MTEQHLPVGVHLRELAGDDDDLTQSDHAGRFLTMREELKSVRRFGVGTHVSSHFCQEVVTKRGPGGEKLFLAVSRMGISGIVTVSVFFDELVVMGEFVRPAGRVISIQGVSGAFLAEDFLEMVAQ